MQRTVKELLIYYKKAVLSQEDRWMPQWHCGYWSVWAAASVLQLSISSSLIVWAYL